MIYATFLIHYNRLRAFSVSCTGTDTQITVLLSTDQTTPIEEAEVQTTTVDTIAPLK